MITSREVHQPVPTWAEQRRVRREEKHLRRQALAKEVYQACQEKKTSEVALQYGRSVSGIYNLLHEFGLKLGHAYKNLKNEEAEARLQSILKAYHEDARSYQSIADDWGITRERVRQILEENGGTDKQRRRQMSRHRMYLLALDRQQEIFDLYKKGLDAREIGKILNMGRDPVAMVLQDQPNYDEVRMVRHARNVSEGVRRKNPRNTYTHEQMMQALQDVAQKVGRTPGVKAYGDNRDKDKHPSSALYNRRYGSWARACELAGLTPNMRPVSRKFGQAKYSEQGYVDALLRVANKLKKIPTYREYSKNRLDSEPTDASFRMHYGTWMASLAAAGLIEDEGVYSGRYDSE